MVEPKSLKLEYLAPHEVQNYKRKLRVSGPKQIEKTCRMLQYVGTVVPLIIDKENTLVVGAHLLEAALQMELKKIPVVQVDHLTKEQVRILRISYERIAEEAQWNQQELSAELLELKTIFPELDLTDTGFEIAEIDQLLFLDECEQDMPEEASGVPPTCQLGDVWILGDHKLFCGSALELESYSSLLGEEKAQLCFTDPPYNVKINGHVGNSGKTQHREFAMASGEMSLNEFTDFLAQSFHQISNHTVDGGILFACMDWRHIQELLGAATSENLEVLNMCVWVKDNGGMGSLYRSRHKLVFVLKNGQGKHTNNVQLGKYGRYRTNVWEYPGINAFGNGRMKELAMHPTVKPTQMVADALKDCSKHGDIILDPFGGSGTTLIAAEWTGRKGRLIELDPIYCDVIMQRWQNLTGGQAIHKETQQTFDEKGGNDDE